MNQLNLSAWGYHRELKLARTIADLAGGEQLQSVHLAEALQYRPKSMMGCLNQDLRRIQKNTKNNMIHPKLMDSDGLHQFALTLKRVMKWVLVAHLPGVGEMLGSCKNEPTQRAGRFVQWEFVKPVAKMA